MPFSVSVNSGGAIAPNKVQVSGGTFGLTGLTNAPVSAGRETVTFVLGPNLAGQVVQCPGYRVPPGARIQMIAAAGSDNNILVGRDRSRLLAGFGESLPPAVVVEFAAANLAELFVYLAAQVDKVTVRVIQD